jgi:hypothetical protein
VECGAPRSELAYLIWTASAALFALPLTFLSCAAEALSITLFT